MRYPTPPDPRLGPNPLARARRKDDTEVHPHHQDDPDVPKGDLSAARAEEWGLTVYDTIAEALRCGGDTLAVDAVLLIGEHGQYPVDEYSMTHWPRYEFFTAITDVFKADGRSVPCAPPLPVTSTHLVSKQSFLLIRLCAQRVQRQAPELELGAGPRHGRDLQIARLPDDGRLRPVRHLAHARSRPPIRRKGEAATTD